MMTMKTMIDVARLAGVSQTTVSRVVNGDERVAEPTVRAVARAMRELGYEARPRRKRRGHKAFETSSRRDVIAVVLLDTSMDMHPAMTMAKLRGVEAAASRAGLTLALTRAREDHEILPALLRPDLCGVLLWGAAIDPELARQIENLPHLWLSSHTADEDSVVLVGNEQAGRMAADYLLDQGIARPATLCPFSSNPQYELRIDGFRYTCHIRNCEAIIIRPTNTDTVEPPEPQTKQIPDLVERLLSLVPMPDGLFIPDDSLTIPVYQLLAEHGIKPEQDIRIVSCDNESTYLNALRPRPATIDLAPEATGRLAVEQLLRRLNAPSDNRQVSVLINPELIPGQEQAASVNARVSD